MLAGELAARAGAIRGVVAQVDARLVERAPLTLAPEGNIVASQIAPHAERRQLAAGRGGTRVGRQRQRLFDCQIHDGASPIVRTTFTRIVHSTNALKRTVVSIRTVVTAF